MNERRIIPYGRQSIDDGDVAAVEAVLRSDFLTCGPAVDAFEQGICEAVGAGHAVAVNNATSALHLAMVAAGIGPGDRVLTSPITFVASANCAAYVGATPDFVDIDPVSCNLDPDALEAAWTDDVKAVVAVDYAGQPCDMPRIAAIARERGAIVIEDACHGIGGAFRHEGRTWKLGGHPWADITTFSFHPVKTMTTGEGGVLTTVDPAIAARARLLRTHGITRDASGFVGLGDTSACGAAFGEIGPWYYEMQELGWNYRITDMQCALGLSQLAKLDSFVRRRREIVSRYNEAFAPLPHVVVPAVKAPAEPSLTSWHLYTVQVDFPSLGLSRSEFMAHLRETGIGSQVLYIPVHLQPWYRRTYGYGAGKCPVAEAFYLRALSLPLFPGMSDADVDAVIRGFSSIVTNTR